METPRFVWNQHLRQKRRFGFDAHGVTIGVSFRFILKIEILR
ncbi:MAG: hypothetical protein ACRD3T_13775 [Terriglobia bacterium]